MNTYVYEFESKLYINLTNRCTNACVFCVRNGNQGVGRHNLWLDKEPTAAEVIEDLKRMRFWEYDEVVFCGFGEPTFKLDEILEIGQFLKRIPLNGGVPGIFPQGSAKGGVVRLNTNGHGNLIHGRDITGELARAVDAVSISLNASTAKGHQEICNSEYGEKAFDAMLEFTRLCVPKFKRTVLSVVDTIGKDEIERCRKVCETTGAEFRVREIM